MRSSSDRDDRNRRRSPRVRRSRERSPSSRKEASTSRNGGYRPGESLFGNNELPQYSTSTFNVPAHIPSPAANHSSLVSEKKRRRTRWGGSEADKIFIPGLPTTLPQNLTKEQEQAYILQLQIEELSRRLRGTDTSILEESTGTRSPSPEPIYDQYGKRTNTREARTRKKLEDERHTLIQEMLKVNPEYKPPSDYKPQQIRFTDKVEIPQDDFPEINFVGLLIGPRGNSLKSLEKETGAKIIIRGKGSVKDGKIGRKEGVPLPGEDEPLHAFITGTTAEVVAKAATRITEIIKNGIEVPESMNELRRQQLRELALLNGTLRENECLNKLKILTEAETIITNTIICVICGGAGHIANDCKLRGTITREEMAKLENQAVDTEYSALMTELGHTVAKHQLKSLSGVACSGQITAGGPVLAIAGAEGVDTDKQADKPSPVVNQDNPPRPQHAMGYHSSRQFHLPPNPQYHPYPAYAEYNGYEAEQYDYEGYHEEFPAESWNCYPPYEEYHNGSVMRPPPPPPPPLHMTMHDPGHRPFYPPGPNGNFHPHRHHPPPAAPGSRFMPPMHPGYGYSDPGHRPPPFMPPFPPGHYQQ